MTESLVERFGWIRERIVFVHAALLAAEATRDSGRGFSTADVRFFFLLFTKWVEKDALDPEQAVELAQVRRVIERLVGAGWAKRVRPAAPRQGGARAAQFALREPGLVALASTIEDAADRGRPFEELLFAICFAASYGPAIRARTGARARA
jgi:hypothetical protein